MQLFKLAFILVAALLLLSTGIEAKKKHKKSHSSNESTKSKTKTKWSTTTDNGANGANSMVASEVHGYYVKRTFLPLDTSGKSNALLQSPPYLAIPIAWFKCEGGDACIKGNSGAAINSNSHALSEGFLCDDDCVELYEPICGKTSSEVAVFYNQCKLNVAKCRTHGLWTEWAYPECKATYSTQVACAEKKFKSSPFFRDNSTISAPVTVVKDPKEDNLLEAALAALIDLDDRLEGAAESVNGEPNEIVPNKVESGKVEPSKVEQNKLEPNKELPNKVETNKVEHSKIEATTISNKV